MSGPMEVVGLEHSEEKKKKTEPKLSWEKTVLLYMHDMICILAIVLVLFSVFFREAVVSGSSMYSTLLDGDYLLLVSNLFYPNPKQGDIIVVSKESFENGVPIVKRIIATEGQTVDIDFEAGIVYVDGEALQESYTNTPTNLREGVEFPLTVEENCVIALGDNRNNSRDSRSPEIGQIDKREILGKAIFRFLPGPDAQTEKRDLSRIGVIR